MEQKEIIEGNRLIAKFRGYREIKGWDGYEYGYTLHPTINVGCTGDMQFKYHLSWDRLMGPVAKIHQLLHDKDRENYKEVKARWVPIANELQNINLENVWFCVVKFIEWYNNQ